MKRLVAVICLLAMVLSLCLSGCGKAATEDSAATAASTGASSDSTEETKPVEVVDTYEAVEDVQKTDETLIVALGQEPSHLVLKMGAGMTAAYIRLLLGDTLTVYDYETKQVKPGLLTEWEFIDELHIRAKVRQGVIACDGTEFNANDILFTLEKGAVDAPNYMAKYFNVPNCVVEDDYTILFELSEVNYSVMSELTNAVCLCYDESSYEDCGGDDSAGINPLWGTGRYKFVEWVPGQYVLIERNDNYWDESYIGYYKYIKYTFVPDSATRMMAVQSGDADIAVDIPLIQAVELVGNDTCDVYNLVNYQNFGIEINCDPELSVLGTDSRLREAIRYAIDADALNLIKTAGFGEREDFWLMMDSPFFTNPTDGVGKEYNPEKAKELLKEAGYEDGLEIKILCNSSNEEVCTALQAMLSEVGITLHLDMSEQIVLAEEGKNGEYDLNASEHQSLCFYRGANVFEKLNPSALASGTINGGPRFVSDELQTLVDLAISTQDDAEGKEAIAKIEKYLWDNCGYVGICSGIYTVVAKPNMGGFAMVSDGGICDVSYVAPLN